MDAAEKSVGPLFRRHRGGWSGQRRGFRKMGNAEYVTKSFLLLAGGIRVSWRKCESPELL
jgi:hypothetical protein